MKIKNTSSGLRDSTNVPKLGVASVQDTTKTIKDMPVCIQDYK